MTEVEKENPCPGCCRALYPDEATVLIGDDPADDADYWHLPCLRHHAIKQAGGFLMEAGRSSGVGDEDRVPEQRHAVLLGQAWATLAIALGPDAGAD